MSEVSGIRKMTLEELQQERTRLKDKIDDMEGTIRHLKYYYQQYDLEVRDREQQQVKSVE